MPSTHKKVIVRKIGRDTVAGYLAPAAFVRDGQLELLNTAGNLVRIDLREIKSVSFVRDFAEQETLARKTFTTRPRAEGLWVRLKFKDNDLLEGLMSNDLMQIATDGFLLTPPDTRGNTQRIFIPRAALAQLTVLAVIGGLPGRRRPAKDETVQPQLFNE